MILSGLLTFLLSPQLGMFLLNLCPLKLEKESTLLSLALMDVEKVHFSEFSVDYGHSQEELSKDPAFKNFFMFLKDLTYHQELSEIKLFILTLTLLCKEREKLMKTSVCFWNMWNLNISKKDKEVLTLSRNGKMFFQEERNNVSQWQDSSITNPYSVFLMSAQVQ